MIITTFSSLKPSAFISQVERIVQELTGNANFPEPWSTGVPSMAQLQTDFSAYQSVLSATTAGDKTRIFERNAARAQLANDLSLIGCYLQIASQNNANQLATTGFPLRQAPVRGPVTTVPAAPGKVMVSRGPLSGMLVVSSSKVQGAGSYNTQVATGDPTVEANWTAAGSSKNCRSFSIQGLTPGKLYSVRVCGVGRAGPGPWTTSGSLMVV